MQDTSFDSLDLNEYTLDIKEVLCDYAIDKDIWKDGYSIHEGTMIGTTQKVRIYRRPFTGGPDAKRRFRALMAAFNQGIVLADNIFLSHEDHEYFIYIVEPWMQNNDDKFVPLSRLLKTDISYIKKHRLFQNLIIIVKSLHELGEAHMELCPQNIWVEDEFQVYLRPFKLVVDTDKSKKFQNSHSRSHPKYWYSSPEYTLQLFKHIGGTDLNDSAGSLDSSLDNTIDNFANDLWSLGCIFSEMFISMTPLFQAIDPFDRLVGFFEFIGIPRKEDVFYMTKELYDSIVHQIETSSYGDDEFPFIKGLLANLSREEIMPLKTLLSFNPDKRPKCEELIKFPFFKASTPFERKGPLPSNPESRRVHTEGQQSGRESQWQKAQYNSLKKTKQDQSRQMNNSVSAVKKTASEKNNNSSWWNLDLFGEQSQIGDAHAKHEGGGEMFNMQTRSPTFFNNPNLNTFAKPIQMPLMDISQGNFENENSPNDKGWPGQKSGTKKTYASGEFPMMNKPQYHSISKENYRQPEDHLSHKKNRTHSNMSEFNFAGGKDNRGTGSVVIHHEGRPSLPADMRSFTQVKHFPQEHERQYMSHSVRTHRAQEANNVKFTVLIEQLRNVVTEAGSYYCRIELRTSDDDNGIISFNSELTPVRNRAVKFDFVSEIDLDLELAEKIFRENSFTVFLFHEPMQQQSYMQQPEILPYGLCEISLSSLLPNPGRSFRSNATRTLTGWYDVTDPDDDYATIGQIKVDINLDTTKLKMGPSPARTRQERANTNRTKMQNLSVNYASMKDSYVAHERRQTTEYSSVSLPENERIHERPSTRGLPPKAKPEKKPSEMNQSIFDIIQNDLKRLNEDLKHKELEYQKDAEVKKKRTAEAHDFANVVSKLREILEGDEEFCY